MFRWTSRRYLQVVRASAAYDLVVTAGFATPWTLAWLHAGLGTLAAATGVVAPPPLDTMQVLFANLLGIVVVVWALVRLRAPSVTLGRHDAAARAGFALAQAYALAHGATPLLAGFTAMELVFLAAQLPAPRPAAR